MSKRIWAAIYFLCVAGFLILVANFYRPGYGFTGLIEFGDQFDTTNIAGLHCLVEPGSSGYDGQFYAKLSLDPLLVNPAKASTGIDAPYYRARRIFLSWSAWALGLGHPAWIMQVYALQNVVCWLVLAWLLTRWFPPLDFNNFARWAGILFSFGLMHSVRASLTDGPALLLVAIALVLCEKKKETLASVVLAIAGLMRETSLLGFAALADPAKRSPRDLGRIVLRAILVAAPLACWIIYLKLRLGNSHNAAGVGNFDLPFVAWAQKWASVLPLLREAHWGWRVAALQLALTVQAFYFFLHPQPSKPAWRIGAVFATLMFCLGSAVWGGIPGATGRAVLPMLLAFNLVVPRGGRWWMVLLIAGNLSVLGQPLLETSAPGDVGYVNVADSSLNTGGKEFALRFGPGWYKPERGFLQSFRRWSPGTVAITIENPCPVAVEADVAMQLSATKGAPRQVALQWNKSEVWSGTLGDGVVPAPLQSVRLEPGENQLVFETDPAPGGVTRPMAFCLHGMKITVRSNAKP